MGNTTYEDIVESLELSPHPEGGYYKEVYRSKEKVQKANGNQRTAGTGIYFLLQQEVCTNWHRVASDERWHFYKGDRLILEIIDQDGSFERSYLDDKLSGDSCFQGLVPRNCWQRAYSTGAYSLVGCTVAPGFEFEDFEMVKQEALVQEFPNIASKIRHDPFS